MSGWYIPRNVWGYGLTVWIFQGQVELPLLNSTEQGSPAGGLHAANRLSMDAQPLRFGREFCPADADRLGDKDEFCHAVIIRSAWLPGKILPHTYSFDPSLLSLGCRSCSSDSMNGAMASLLGLWRARTLNGSRLVLWVYINPQIFLTLELTIVLVNTQRVLYISPSGFSLATLIHQNQIQNKVLRRCFGMS